ncbi:MAG: hypothetical protein KAT77_04105 [Nanoarchaeota archaeon]|nr:hypothetical protein [Nanoarchaeota archaeon]
MDLNRLIKRIEKYIGRNLKLSMKEFKQLQKLKENVILIEELLSHHNLGNLRYKEHTKKLIICVGRIERRLNVWIIRLEKLLTKEEYELSPRDRQYFELFKNKLDICKNNLIRILAWNGELHQILKKKGFPEWDKIMEKVDEAFGNNKNPGINTLIILFEQLGKVEEQLLKRVSKEDWLKIINEKIETNGNILDRTDLSLRVDSSSYLSAFFRMLRFQKHRECLVKFNVKERITSKGVKAKNWQRELSIAIDAGGFQAQFSGRVNNLYKSFLKRNKGNRTTALIGIGRLIGVAYVALNESTFEYVRRDLAKLEEGLQSSESSRISFSVQYLSSRYGGLVEFKKFANKKDFSEEEKQELSNMAKSYKYIIENFGFDVGGYRRIVQNEQGLVFSGREYRTIKRIVDDPKSILRNPKEVLLVLSQGLARYDAFHRFNYDIAVIINNKYIFGVTYQGPSKGHWGDIDDTNTPDKFKEAYLGIICLIHNNAFYRKVIKEMLAATVDKPELRLPIYNVFGKVIWPS